MTTLAIDIGGTKLTAALIGTDGQIRDHRELPTPASQTPQVLRDILSTLISPLQAHAQRVAIASTGIIHDGSLLALNPRNLSGLLYFPLVKTLEQLTNLPTIAINDTQTAAWMEYQTLDGNITDMMFVTISTDVGDGVVNGGKLRISPGGLAGHIGHTLANPHGPACGCGRTGYVEAIAPSRGIATAAQGELTDANAKTISTRTGQDDEQAQQLTHRSTHTPTRLIADIKATTDYQCVVVGGNVGLAKGYLTLVKTCLVQRPAAFHVDLLTTRYHHGAGLLRATLLAQGEILWQWVKYSRYRLLDYILRYGTR